MKYRKDMKVYYDVETDSLLLYVPLTTKRGMIWLVNRSSYYCIRNTLLNKYKYIGKY